MPIVADAAVAIRGDLSGFNKDLKGADKQVGGLGAKLKGALTPTGILAGAGIAIGGAQVLSFFSDSVNAAAEFNDAMGATGVIFGEEMIPDMEEWAASAAQNFGASKREALNAANVIATLGKSAGLTGEELTGFSQEMVQLGGDLASMFGGSTQDAITAVGAALRGESEPIRRYGVLLDDATLRQKAFEMGLISTTANALTPQQRVLAAQASILEQTTDAQGDFLRTSDGMANTQRELAAEMDNVSVEIGEKLLPVALDFANFVKDVFIPALTFLSDVLIGPIAQGISSVIEGVSMFVDTITGIPGAIADVAGGAIDAFGDFVTGGKEAMSGLPSDAQIQALAAVRAVEIEYVKGGPVVAAEAGKIAGMLPSEIQARVDEVRAAGRENVVQFAMGLLDAQNDPMVAMEALMRVQEEALTRGEEIARLKGQLTSQELADGLNDNRPAVRLAAQAARLEIENRLKELNAWNWGYNLVGTYAAGMEANLVRVRQAAVAVGSAVGGQIRIESEPPDSHSPLAGITKWGGNIVKTIADGIYGELGAGAGAASALAGALVPGFGSVGPMSLAPAGAAGGTTFILNVDGVTRSVGSKQEAFDELARMQEVWG